MKTMTLIQAAVLMIAASAGSALAATNVPVNVKEGDQTFKGDLYLPDNAQGALPMVVVVHEWWGKTDYPEMRAKKIADELGYAALAVDLYGDAKTVSTPKEAGELATPFYKDPQLGVKRLQAFIAAAPTAAKRAKAAIDPSRTAAIGYCFGGAQVLNLARSGSLPKDEKLLGVVSFHGSLGSSLKAKAPVKSKLLVLHGADDQFVKPDEVAAFKKEMKAAKADMDFVAYPGAGHAFTNPKATEVGKQNQIPIAYDEKADHDSWSKMAAFLKKLFAK